jgi:hypothetical protein
VYKVLKKPYVPLHTLIPPQDSIHFMHFTYLFIKHSVDKDWSLHSTPLWTKCMWKSKEFKWKQERHKAMRLHLWDDNDNFRYRLGLTQVQSAVPVGSSLYLFTKVPGCNVFGLVRSRLCYFRCWSFAATIKCVSFSFFNWKVSKLHFRNYKS